MDRNRPCSGGDSDDGLWYLPGGNGSCFYKSCKYLYGVYWNWMIRK